MHFATKSPNALVIVISTSYSARMETKIVKAKEKTKPAAVMDFNKCMGRGGGGGHYRYDILSLCNREGYTKVLEIIICFNFVDLATMNSYILYRILTADKKMERKQFVIKVLNRLRVNKKLAEGPQ